jgi:hypothetical protein
VRRCCVTPLPAWRQLGLRTDRSSHACAAPAPSGLSTNLEPTALSRSTPWDLWLLELSEALSCAASRSVVATKILVEDEERIAILTAQATGSIPAPPAKYARSGSGITSALAATATVPAPATHDCCNATRHSRAAGDGGWCYSGGAGAGASPARDGAANCGCPAPNARRLGAGDAAAFCSLPLVQRGRPIVGEPRE